MTTISDSAGGMACDPLSQRSESARSESERRGLRDEREERKEQEAMQGGNDDDDDDDGDDEERASERRSSLSLAFCACVYAVAVCEYTDHRSSPSCSAVLECCCCRRRLSATSLASQAVTVTRAAQEREQRRGLPDHMINKLSIHEF